MKATWLLPLSLCAAACGQSAETEPAEAADSAEAAPAPAATADWNGTYKGEFVYPKGDKEITPATDFGLVLGNGTCELTQQGYQVDRAIVCSTEASGDELAVLFKSFPDGKLTNQYDVEEFKPGERLFTLKRTDGKIMAQWAAVEPHENAEPLEMARQ